MELRKNAKKVIFKQKNSRTFIVSPLKSLIICLNDSQLMNSSKETIYSKFVLGCVLSLS